MKKLSMEALALDLQDVKNTQHTFHKLQNEKITEIVRQMEMLTHKVGQLEKRISNNNSIKASGFVKPTFHNGECFSIPNGSNHGKNI